MGWNRGSFHAKDDNDMTLEQRKLILSLWEQVDKVPPDTYGTYVVGPKTRKEASALIDKLKTKLEKRKNAK